MVFVSSITPLNTSDVDHFLELGTSLHQHRCRHDGYMLTQVLEGEVELDNKTIITTMGNSISGTVLQRQDNEDALTLTLESAVSKVLKETSKFFLTVGNSPGSTVGVKYEMDSHSRDNKGMCCPDGKAVVLKKANTENFITYMYMYVRETAQSLSTSNLQFEITGVSFKESRMSTTSKST